MEVGCMTGSARDRCDLGVCVTQVSDSLNSVKAETVGRCEQGSVPGNHHQSWRRGHSFVGRWCRKHGGQD